MAKVKTVVLTSWQAALFDSGDAQAEKELMSDLREKYGPVDSHGTVVVVHPEGFVVNTFRG
jgi:hypothetical protein